jgi:hypothetical protein
MPGHAMSDIMFLVVTRGRQSPAAAEVGAAAATAARQVASPMDFSEVEVNIFPIVVQANSQLRPGSNQDFI